jgi:hypothetical protein
MTGAIGDAALSATGIVLGARARSSLHMQLVGDKCGEEFTAFDAETAKVEDVRGVRDQERLNWRMTQHPLVRHEILCARSDGRLAGYLAFRSRTGLVIRVVDLVTRDDDSSVALALLSRLACIGRERGAAVLTVNILEGSAQQRVYRHAGFFRADQARWAPVIRATPSSKATIIVYAPAAPAHVANAVTNPRNWHFSQADFED